MLDAGEVRLVCTFHQDICFAFARVLLSMKECALREDVEEVSIRKGMMLNKMEDTHPHTQKNMYVSCKAFLMATLGFLGRLCLALLWSLASAPFYV